MFASEREIYLQKLKQVRVKIFPIHVHLATYSIIICNTITEWEGYVSKSENHGTFIYRNTNRSNHLYKGCFKVYDQI